MWSFSQSDKVPLDLKRNDTCVMFQLCVVLKNTKCVTVVNEELFFL